MEGALTLSCTHACTHAQEVRMKQLKRKASVVERKSYMALELGSKMTTTIHTPSRDYMTVLPDEVILQQQLFRAYTLAHRYETKLNANMRIHTHLKCIHSPPLMTDASERCRFFRERSAATFSLNSLYSALVNGSSRPSIS